MKPCLLLAALLVAGTSSITAWGTTYYVVPDGNDLASGLSWEDAQGTIQCAIDNASGGDIIILGEGTYTGDGNRDIDFDGKAVIVRSVDPNDPNVVAGTLIDSQGTQNDPHRGFLFHCGETADSVLEGITITGGYSSYGGAILCTYEYSSNFSLRTRWGAVYDDLTICPVSEVVTGTYNDYGEDTQYTIAYSSPVSPTIRKCLIRDNWAMWGGGICIDHSSPTIIDCNFTGNYAEYDGGALWDAISTSLISNCAFTANEAGYYGGAIMNYDCATYPVIERCSFSRNQAEYSGGAIFNDAGEPEIRSCVFTANQATEEGSALVHSNGYSSSLIENCTFVEHTGSVLWNFSDGNLIVTNCIFWDPNATAEITNEATIAVTYSDVRGGFAGLGNIYADPNFAADGYHLTTGSLCVDAGDPCGYIEAQDYDGMARVTGGHVDIGADEYYGIFYVDMNATGAGNGTSWEDAWTDLESGLDYARNNPGAVTEIRVATGMYVPTREMIEDDPLSVTFELAHYLKLTGGYPEGGGLRDIRKNKTILSGLTSSGNCYHVVTACSAEVVLDGFTIQDGAAVSETGTSGYHDPYGSFWTNSLGGGVYCSSWDTEIINCNIINNQSLGLGAGVYVRWASVKMTNCVLSDNSASCDGGGIYIDEEGDATITNCTIVDNASSNSGGIALAWDDDVDAYASVENSIIWGNTGDVDVLTAQIYGDMSAQAPWWARVAVNYSCVQAWNTNLGGTGNIGNDSVNHNPDFRDSENGDYHLAYTSPCIDAGDPTGNYTGQVDMDGQGRELRNNVDMGADELPGVFYVDQEASGADDGSSWEDAFTELSEALTSLSQDTEITEIWVAAGTYKPGTSRTDSFQLVEGVNLYGGFFGTETTLTQRDHAANVTILSGDIDGDGVLDADNSYHVVKGANNATLDGFTIARGYADGSGEDAKGAGMYISSGSGLIMNCRFSSNAAMTGAAIYVDTATTPTIKNCVIYDNLSAGMGAGIYSKGIPSIENCTISRNTASSQGGGIAVEGYGTRQIRNSIIWGNTATPWYDSDVYAFDNASIHIYYSNYRCLQSHPGGLIYLYHCVLAGDPLFADSVNGDFHLRAYTGRWNGTTWVRDSITSPCVDRGDPSSIYSNEPAPNGRRVNIGAYGNTGYASKAVARNELDKLLASDGAAGDRFGTSVSISGDHAIVGVRYDDDNGTGSGSAYVFVRNGSSWTQQGKLIASDGQAYDYFGIAVSIDGDYAIVGAFGDDDNGEGSGSAYVFKRDGLNWIQEAILRPSDGAAWDWAGGSVSMCGDCALVGAAGKNGKRGAAYVFKREGTTWDQQAKLTASDQGALDNFGGSVSIDGDYAIIGAWGWDPSYPYDSWTDTGAAYIFKRDGANWIQQQRLDGVYVHSESYFGASVSVSGDYAIVGAYMDLDSISSSETGAVYIYKRDGTTWSQQALHRGPDTQSLDYFGCSVCISGDFAVVGATGDDDNGSNSGSAFVFMRDGTTWALQSELLASDGFANDSFGSISVSGNDIFVGATGDDDNGDISGSVYTFEAADLP